MCGRYHIKLADLGKTLLLLESMGIAHIGSPADLWPSGLVEMDVRPSEYACVLKAGELGGAEFARQRWGFPNIRGGMLINARAETVMEKPTFRGSFSRRRIVIPASWFYEWNASKEKFSFAGRGRPPLCLAGISSLEGGHESFVILTTEANASVSGVHPRMPLVLEGNEPLQWLTSGSAAEKLLKKTPSALDMLSGQKSIF